MVQWFPQKIVYGASLEDSKVTYCLMTNQMNEDILESPYSLQKAQKLNVNALNLLHSAGALMG